MSTQTQGQTKLQQAHAAIQAAEILIAQEHRDKLEADLRAAIELAGQIAKQIENKRAYLAPLEREAVDLWNQREVLNAEMRELTSQEFFLPEEIEAAEKRLGALDQQHSKLTKRISELTYLRAPVEHEIMNLEFDQREAMKAVKGIRLGLSGQLQGPTNGGAVRTASM
jgi:chromosome segregation ATPase